MKFLLPTAIIIAYITIIQASKLESNLNGCATPYQKENIDDFFPDKLTPTYAKTFNITYHGTYKVLSNIVTDESYLLYQCGTNPPQDEIDSGKYRVVTSIPLPDGIALTTTVQIRKYGITIILFISYIVFFYFALINIMIISNVRIARIK